MSDNWTFPGYEGRQTRVEVYSADEEVELVLNGESLGRKPAGAIQKNKAVFEVVYQPGTLVAIGLTGGKEAGRSELITTGGPAALRLTPDRTEIRAGGDDLCYLTVEVVDEAGALVRSAGVEVRVEVSGEGELIALGSADPRAEDSWAGEPCRAFEGRALAIVRSGVAEGEIRIVATSPALTGAETRVAALRRLDHAPAGPGV